MKKRIKKEQIILLSVLIIFLIASLIILTALIFSAKEKEETAPVLREAIADEASVDIALETAPEEAEPLTEAEPVSNASEIEAPESTEPDILRFVDVFGEPYETEILPNVPKHEYDLSAFVHEGEKLFYEDENYTCRLGVDVSRYQKNVNWEKVKAAGYEFVFLRLGYRGYGSAGNIKLDQEFDKHMEGAKKAGLDVGVYFFSQAINEEEAVEEAQFVIDHLKNYDLQLPVVYDPESILDDVARTDDVSGEQFTKNTIAFCSAIVEAGYEPMVYSNMLWEAFQFDMDELCCYPFWYADYEGKPQTPYAFSYWQYTNEGKVEGIGNGVDINIQMIPK